MPELPGKVTGFPGNIPGFPNKSPPIYHHLIEKYMILDGTIEVSSGAIHLSQKTCTYSPGLLYVLNDSHR